MWASIAMSTEVGAILAENCWVVTTGRRFFCAVNDEWSTVHSGNDVSVTVVSHLDKSGQK